MNERDVSEDEVEAVIAAPILRAVCQGQNKCLWFYEWKASADHVQSKNRSCSDNYGHGKKETF